MHGKRPRHDSYIDDTYNPWTATEILAELAVKNSEIFEFEEMLNPEGRRGKKAEAEEIRA